MLILPYFQIQELIDIYYEVLTYSALHAGINIRQLGTVLTINKFKNWLVTCTTTLEILRRENLHLALLLKENSLNYFEIYKYRC